MNWKGRGKNVGISDNSNLQWNVGSEEYLLRFFPFKGSATNPEYETKSDLNMSYMPITPNVMSESVTFMSDILTMYQWSLSYQGYQRMDFTDSKRAGYHRKKSFPFLPVIPGASSYPRFTNGQSLIGKNSLKSGTSMYNSTFSV